MTNSKKPGGPLETEGRAKRFRTVLFDAQGQPHERKGFATVTDAWFNRISLPVATFLDWLLSQAKRLQGRKKQTEEL